MGEQITNHEDDEVVQLDGVTVHKLGEGAFSLDKYKKVETGVSHR